MYLRLNSVGGYFEASEEDEEGALDILEQSLASAAGKLNNFVVFLKEGLGGLRL